MCEYLCPCVHLCIAVWAFVLIETDEYNKYPGKMFTRSWVICVLFKMSPHRGLIFNKKYSNYLNECVSRQVVYQCVQHRDSHGLHQRERESSPYLSWHKQVWGLKALVSTLKSISWCVIIANVHNSTWTNWWSMQ